jgi:putative peptidoglycan lipid II flippase
MRQTSSIPAAALLLATGILLSRVLGYVREMLLAYRFGAGQATDAFYAAFQIPDLLNYFLAGGALSIAFIPLYNKTRARDGDAAADRMMGTVLGTLGAFAIAVTAVLWWKAEELVRFQFPHFGPGAVRLTTHLTRIVLPAQVFFITGGIVQAVLLARLSFRAAAAAPLIYNAFIIAGGWFLYPMCGIDGFAYGTLAGAVAGPFLLPLMHARGHIPLKVRFAPRDKNFLTYLALAAPLMFGQTLLTLDEWYCRWFGALLAPGTVAHLSYARRLMQVPIAVIGQAVAAAALPALSKLWAEQKAEEMNTTLLATLRTGLSLSVLAGAAFYVVARPLVDLVYFHGAFTRMDAESVAALVALFAFAMPGWIVQQISVRAFYARGDTWRPMAFGTVLSLLVIPLYLSFSRVMGAEGLALAGAISMTVNAAATIFFARLLHGAPAMAPLLSSFMRAGIISVAAAISAYMALHLRQDFYAGTALHPKILALLDGAVGGGIFGLTALAGILLIGDAPLRIFLKKRFHKRGA